MGFEVLILFRIASVVVVDAVDAVSDVLEVFCTLRCIIYFSSLDIVVDVNDAELKMPRV